jgi:hypothetical protein
MFGDIRDNRQWSFAKFWSGSVRYLSGRIEAQGVGWMYRRVWNIEAIEHLNVQSSSRTMNNWVLLKYGCFLRLRRAHRNSRGGNVLRTRNHYLQYSVSIQCLRKALNNLNCIVSCRVFFLLDESGQGSPDFSFPTVVGFGAKECPCRQPRLNCRRHTSASFPSNCR